MITIRLLWVTSFFVLVYYITDSKAKEQSCHEVVSGFTKMQFGGIAKCTKKMKFKNGKEKAAKMTCILRCVTMDIGFLDPEGQILLNQTDVFLEQFFPESMRQKAKDTFQPCLDLADGKEFKSLTEDPYCTSYDALFKCFVGAFPTLCN